jgi:23S rRNA (guanosine2251-2'-O)-methyltransferase
MYNSETYNEKDLVFGIHPVKEALLKGSSIDKVLIQKGAKSEAIHEIRQMLRQQNVIWQEVPIEKLNRVTRANHQGIIALISPIIFQHIEDIIPSIFEKGEVPLLLVLDRLTDVRNFGAICRTAESVGAHAVIIPDRGSARIGGDMVKTSAGAILNVPVCRSKNLKEVFSYLAQSGIHIFACSEKGEKYYFQEDLSIPLALLMGSEEDGISAEYFQYCDAHIKIPMKGKTGSLNVSVATGVILYETIRQRMII